MQHNGRSAPTKLWENEVPDTNSNDRSAWDKAKRAASELFNWNKTEGTRIAQPESDKKRMLFVLADKNNPAHFDETTRSWIGDYSDIFDKGVIGEMGGNPAIYYLNSAQEGIHDPGVVIRTIREHVHKYGTLKELMISGHGNKTSIGKSADLNLNLFLNDLEQLQKDAGLKIADRIVFNGCGVLGNFFPDDEESYKKHAKQLGAEIAGATTIVYGSDGGRFVKFTPDGTVKRDRIDNPAGYQSGQAANQKFGGSESRWDLGGDEWAEKELTKPLVTPTQKSKTDNPKRSQRGTAA